MLLCEAHRRVQRSRRVRFQYSTGMRSARASPGPANDYTSGYVFWHFARRALHWRQVICQGAGAASITAQWPLVVSTFGRTQDTPALDAASPSDEPASFEPPLAPARRAPATVHAMGWLAGAKRLPAVAAALLGGRGRARARCDGRA